MWSGERITVVVNYVLAFSRDLESEVNWFSILFLSMIYRSLSPAFASDSSLESIGAPSQIGLLIVGGNLVLIHFNLKHFR